jgi:hypothetical protein
MWSSRRDRLRIAAGARVSRPLIFETHRPVLVTRDGGYRAYSVNRASSSEVWQLSGLTSR